MQMVVKTTTTPVDGTATTTTETLNFSYDASGVPMAVNYGGTDYYYVTNIQGDVMAILNTSGNAVVEYTYDAWGNIHTTTGTLAETLGEVNPLTYRGYVYDRESDYYYLQSRYYDPNIGRFINADALATTGQGLLGNNMFAYCNNNSVVLADYNGLAPWPCTTVINDGAKEIEAPYPYYRTPEEAALAFASSYYMYTVITGNEIAALIYEYQLGGHTYYNYGFITYEIDNNAYNSVTLYIDPVKTNGWFSGYRIVGEIHTHPNTNVFSDGDIWAIQGIIDALGDGYSAFLATPDMTVIMFDMNLTPVDNRGIHVGNFQMREYKGFRGTRPMVTRKHQLV